MEEKIKIITPGNCDYFRKVVVPAALGPDTGENAPKNGAYRNVILEYAANGNAYIYSSDGIPTKINDYLPDESVTTDKIVNGAVTTAKIASGAVTSSKIDFATFPDTTLALSDVSPLSGIVDYSSSYKFSCHKTKAGVVQLYLYIKNTSGSAIASYTNLLQLPEGYRPVARVHSLVNPSGGTIEILTNGYLQYSTSLSDGNGILATFCFLTS